MCAFTGVLNLALTLANQSGSNPSRPCATMIRVVPM